MRNIKHHSIIITSHDLELIRQVRLKITALVKLGVEASNGIKLIGEPSESLINNYHTLIVYPDGSKEGHETSEDWDIVRKKIATYLADHNKTATEDKIINFVEVFFGSDDGKAGIITHG